MNSWQEFLDKLKEAKKSKKTKGLNVGAITRLIYAGAFDSLIGSENPAFEVYEKMYEEIKSALKSKASLPRASKTQVLGIQDIKSQVTLCQWRAEASPIFKFNLVSQYHSQLISNGFIKNEETADRVRKTFLYVREKTGEDGIIEKAGIVGSWDEFWKLPEESIAPFLLKSVVSGNNKYNLLVGFVGFISETKKQFFGEDAREMLKVKLYLGRDYTNFLVQWPDRKTGIISPRIISRLEEKKAVLLLVKPNLYKGKIRGGSIEEIIPFNL